MLTTHLRTAPADVPAQLADADLALMLMIRHFERAVLDLYGQGKLNGTTHTCQGQEYVPVALTPLLHPDDYVLSNHRGHGHYLARFADPDGLLAEVMGRTGGVCDGVGGSQHIHRDRYLSTGVQGESVAVAAGVALHLKRTEPGRLAVVYIGDGTWGEGAVYEALNMAALWELPLAVVVENNGIAQSTPTTMAMAGTIRARAQAFGIDHVAIDSTDVEEIRTILRPVLASSRTGSRPSVIEFNTVRLGPHSKGDDTRDSAEMERIREADWYRRYQVAYPDQFRHLDEQQRQHIQRLVEEVSARGPSTWGRP